MRKSPLAIILTTVFIALVGFGIIIPLIPIFAERYGAGGVEVGLLMMSYSAMQFLFAPIAGKISDKIGRRPVIIAALAITTISYVLFALADNLTAIFISRILAGLGGSDLTVAQAYIADVTPPEKRTRGMGLFGAAFGVGFTVGPTLTALLSPIHYQLPLFVAAIFTGVTTLIALIALPEPQKHLTSNRKIIRSLAGISRPVFTVTMLQFFAVFIQSIFHSMLILYTFHTLGWLERQNGFFLGILGVISASIQGGMLGILVKTFGQTSLVKSGFLFMCVGSYVLGSSSYVTGMVGGGILISIGFSLIIPTLSSLVSLVSPVDELGRTMGIFQSTGSMARILAPIAGGFMFDHISYSSPFICGSLIAIVTAVIAFATLRGSAYKFENS
ncbi:MAG: MFS transporter [Candidatus Electryonea clarkiae]|nr:MFS transporter [Candidatus Electryonea clarkiae]MDP8285292.1 MFS transporter [Candidatus Electryonea clarkiae]